MTVRVDRVCAGVGPPAAVSNRRGIWDLDEAVTIIHAVDTSRLSRPADEGQEARPDGKKDQFNRGGYVDAKREQEDQGSTGRGEDCERRKRCARIQPNRQSTKHDKGASDDDEEYPLDAECHVQAEFAIEETGENQVHEQGDTARLASRGQYGTRRLGRSSWVRFSMVRHDQPMITAWATLNNAARYRDVD